MACTFLRVTLYTRIKEQLNISDGKVVDKIYRKNSLSRFI